MTIDSSAELLHIREGNWIKRTPGAWWFLAEIPVGQSGAITLTAPVLVRLGDDGTTWSVSVPQGTSQLLYAGNVLWVGSTSGVAYITNP